MIRRPFYTDFGRVLKAHNWQGNVRRCEVQTALWLGANKALPNSSLFVSLVKLESFRLSSFAPLVFRVPVVGLRSLLSPWLWLRFRG
ncbi:hypothetical protein I7I48_09061 [Histoplasma ohiense]|nr:hypothetical protein I7I48_09061 [Histoplasma ohiense (nom. inval.)]